MAELVVHTALLTDALRLFRDFKNRTPNAVAEVRDLFPATAACFLCDAEIGADFDLFVGPDPNRTSMGLIAPICAPCMEKPLQQRLHAVRKLIASMFPRFRQRHDIAITPAAVLRRLG